MGGRGASSGISKAGKKYGSEYTTLLQSGNIKFVRYNDAKSAKTPMETMTRNRVYVTVNNKDEIMAITYHDKDNKRKKQIDLTHMHKQIKGNHTHDGYEHEENGTRRLNVKEKKMVERVNKLWLNRSGKK